MKTRLIILFLFTSLLSYAQITTLGESTKEKAPKGTDKEIPKYDSLSNFIKINGNYKHLIGQRAYCYNVPPSFPISVKETLKQEIIGKYFAIIEDSNNERGIAFKLIITNEALKIAITSEFCFRLSNYENPNNYFIVDGYFEKAKQVYEGKQLVFMRDDRVFEYDSDHFNGLFNMETRKRDKSVKKKSIWNCTGVSIDENAYCYLDNEDPVVLTLFNEEYGTYYCFLRSEDINCDKAPKNYILGKFLSYEDFTKKQKSDVIAANKKAEADKTKAKEKEEKELQHIQALVAKYGQSNVDLARQGKVKIGWNKELCKEAWGEPGSINKTTTAYGVHEQWVYSTSRYLYFDDGVLTAIQE